MLDVSSFQKAFTQLHRSIEICESDLPAVHPVVAQQLRAGAIQAFEFTYEIAIKMLRRQLEDTDAAGVDLLPFRDVLRLGAERGLIDDPVAWFDFRAMRNITAHSYDDAKARQIYAVLPGFAERAAFLLAALERLNPCA